MLHFLRRIRRSLINTGATRKYLLYAVGEILLVMIGILLALQVNNWNEGRKERLVETELLLELREGLKHDLEDININFLVQTNALKSQNVLLKWLDSDLPLPDSLDRHFAAALMITQFAPRDGSYQTLQQLGTRIIRNDSLRNNILNVYDFLYRGYLKNIDFYLDLVKHNIQFVNPAYFDNLQIFDLNGPDFIGKLKPKSEEVIRKGGTYRYHVNANSQFNELIIKMNIIPTRDNIAELIQMIEDELELN